MFYQLPALVHPRLRFPSVRNYRSQHSRGLTGWWPLATGAGSETAQSHTRKTKTRAYSAFKPFEDDLIDQALDTDDNFRPYFVGDGEMGSALQQTANFTEFRAQGGNAAFARYFTVGAGSISIWFRAETNGPSSASIFALTGICGQVDSGGYYGLSWGDYTPSTGQKAHAWVFDTGYKVASSAVLALDRWYFLVMRWDGSTVKLFIDGIEVASTAAGNIGSSIGMLRTGSYAVNNTAFRAADARTYNVALDGQLIYELWHPATRWELYELALETYFVPLGGGQTIAVGQVTETDLAQAIASLKAVAVAQVTESDLAQALVALKTVALGQASETDLAHGLTSVKTLLLGQVLETDLAQAVTSAKAQLLAQVLEVDLAQPVNVGGAQTIPVDQVSELDAAQGVTWAPKHRLVVTAVELDEAQAVGRIKSLELALVSESDLAQGVTWAPMARLVGQVVELDEAQTVTAAGGALVFGFIFDIPRPLRDHSVPSRARTFIVPTRGDN